MNVGELLNMLSSNQDFIQVKIACASANFGISHINNDFKDRIEIVCGDVAKIKTLGDLKDQIISKDVENPLKVSIENELYDITFVQAPYKWNNYIHLIFIDASCLEKYDYPII